MKKLIFTAILIICLLFIFLVYLMDLLRIIQLEKFFPSLEAKNSPTIEDASTPTNIEKIQLEKREKQVIEKKEILLQEIEKLQKEKEIVQKKINTLKLEKDNLNFQREELKIERQLFENKKDKIKEMSIQIRNMEPQKAKEMMESWNDYDIINVLRQIDIDSEEEGRLSITPYLLTLFEKERRSAIARKMLTQEEPDNTE